MLSELVQYQGKAGFFKLNFQDGISQNTGICELGQFLLRQCSVVPWALVVCLINTPEA